MATARQRAAAARNLIKARAAKKRKLRPAGAVSISAVRSRTPAQQKHYTHLANKIAALPPQAPPFGNRPNQYKIHGRPTKGGV